ncbi:ATP-binding protein [Streptomyces sp. NPDC046465]|uniref:ATP-binding protein n=1 Tax=Streptomyces sp. NPDC046465 TaxID=3155810 RepID=UPI0033E08835
MPESKADHPASTPASTPSPWAYSLTVPNDPRSVTVSRQALRLILRAHGLPHLADAAELLATELVANAVQHTAGPASLRLYCAGATLRIAVWDTDPTPPCPGPASVSDEAGRGLGLVRECSDGWGWCAPGPTRGPQGKFVWCELLAAVV